MFEKIIIFILMVFSLGMHEVGHAKMASFFGDPTPHRDGVNTWNPLVHIKRAFTWCVIVPGLTWFGSGFFIGGAYVMLRPDLMRPQRLGYFMAVLAGPMTNVLLGFVFYFLVLVTVFFIHDPQVHDAASIYQAIGKNIFVTAFYEAAKWNVLLACFNLIPLPPLDGGSLAEVVMPPLRRFFNPIRPYSFVILIVALQIPRVSNILFAPVVFASQVMGTGVGKMVLYLVE